MRLPWLLASPLLLAGACAMPAPEGECASGLCVAAPAAPAPGPQAVAGLLFFIEPPVTAPGGPVTLVLRNATGYEVGYNLCRSGLERRQADGWMAVPLHGACTAQLNVVAPGREARYRYPLPAALRLGEYRFETFVEAPLNSSPQQRIVSEPFIVRR